MSKFRGRGALAVIITVAGLSLSQGAWSAVLNFDTGGCGPTGTIPCANDIPIDQQYGDTDQIDIRYYNSAGGGSVLFWGDGYGSLSNVIYAGHNGVGNGSITFTPKAGFEVSLKSFKTASYQQRDIQLQYFVDADALAYFQYDVISPDPDTFSLIDINSPYFASAIRLTFGPNSYYSALDDITFDVRAIDTMAVPGPIAGAGLPALMALGGLVAWRRRKAAVAA